MAHVVLFGDSIFDNAAYVNGGPDVVRQLQARLPAGWRATLRAKDGAVIADVVGQLAAMPDDASHVVLSIGGNNALGHMPVLEDPTTSMAAAIGRIASIADAFRQDYQAMLDAVLSCRLPTAICTIYEPRFPDARLQRLGVTALMIFNEVITREAFAHGLPLLDLRLVCNSDADYANPIEPSVQGGDKIAATIARAVAEHDFATRRTEVFVH